jgi:hypothetical protein
MAKGGKRPKAGRPKGAKNKATIERQMKAVQVQARDRGKEADAPKLAKDIIEYFMGVALRYAQAYELTGDDLSYSDDAEVQALRDWKRNQVKGWARLAVAWGADLAPYQSPTFRAISISPAQDDGPKGGTVVMHTIEQVREQLILRGVPPDQLGRALIGPPPMMEQEQTEKKR